MTMICTRHITADDQPQWSGEPCPDCGHTSLGHPGITNLTLDACLVCEVQAAVGQLRDTATDQGLELAQTIEQLERAISDAAQVQATAQAALAEQLAQLQARVDAAQLDVLGEQVRDLNDDAARWVDSSELAALRARVEALEAPSMGEGA